MRHLTSYAILLLVAMLACSDTAEDSGNSTGPDTEEQTGSTVPPKPVWQEYPEATDADLSVLNGSPINGIFYADHRLTWDIGGDPFAEGWTYELQVTNRLTGQTSTIGSWSPDFVLDRHELAEALGYVVANRKSNVPLPDPIFFSMNLRGYSADGEPGPGSDVLNFAMFTNSFSFIFRSSSLMDSATVVGIGAGGATGPSSADAGQHPDSSQNSGYFTGPYGQWFVEGAGPELGSRWSIRFLMLHPPQPFIHHWDDTSTWNWDDTMAPYVTTGFAYQTNYDSHGLGGGYIFGRYVNDPDGLHTGYTQVLGYNTYMVSGKPVDVLELSFEGLYTWESAGVSYSKTISGSGQFVVPGG